MSQDDAGVVGSSSVAENDRSKAQRIVDSNNEDKISYLPEGVLGKILSLLVTKDAIRTSVLSKRWIYNWTLIDKIDLDDTLLYSKIAVYSQNRSNTVNTHFVNLVNRILRHVNSSIQSCHLKLSLDNSYHLNSWIIAILEKRVQNLRIRAAAIYFVLYPCSLFDCNTLVELILDIDCTVKVPMFNCLPKLQLLRLYGITFDCSSSSTKLKEFVLSLPVLKVFASRQCLWYNVTIDAPLLESFYLEFFNNGPSYATPTCPLGVVRVCTSGVAKFFYRGHLLEGIVVFDPPLVHNASTDLLIETCQKEDVQDTATHVCVLLSQIKEVECLKLAFRKVYFLLWALLKSFWTRCVIAFYI
ncbi:putative F-box domain, leucine-rich repeat domain, L domain-containing protein [Lupinus albus]|uniref:Putative F-box domain, leucine-rich repeat domain, L domain-containing protein n=1 Tax=Lupinus albus TaxID=3870 RepID=A0A6A4QW09_LUPAL|nr:putative F-box domain, leucine-rich repeat domain, L domain-containing protein [Lupinus albus]